MWYSLKKQWKIRGKGEKNVGKYKLKKMLSCLTGSLILAGVLAVGVDIVLAWVGTEVSCSAFLLGAAALTGLFFWRLRTKPGKALKYAACLLTVLTVSAAAVFVGWKHFSDSAPFSGVDKGKKALYSGQNVMLITPHQDDDINVLGGVMEEYVRYGSRLVPVFVTNGDYYGLAQERFRETLEVMDYIGIPAEDVIFLGYGDTWKEGGPHLYNAPEGVVMESYSGHTATYGTETHGVYREGRAYTVENLMADLESVILEYRPDVIYCSDYDIHIDHKATTLAFEKVMGKLLKENPDYRPQVFKGYAYSTAWYAQPDFYEINLLSTQNVFAEPYDQTPASYRWEDRLRLPVGDYTLSRSLVSSGIYHTLALYASQEAHFQASGIINGDKVVWYRDTDSVCREARVQAASGNAEVLTDFMILENNDLTDRDRLPADGVWIPENGDRTVTFSFTRPVDLDRIALYDSPSPEDNVRSGSIVFDDGTEIGFGPLAPEGAATWVPVQKEQVTAFTVTLMETEGDRAGLAEVEAFEEAPDHALRFLKLTDGEDNFVYDWITEGSEGHLKIYSQGLTGEELGSLSIRVDNLKCWAGFEDGAVRFICPEGKSMTLTVGLEGEDISDTVRIRNPGKVTRLYYSLCQNLEEQVFRKYCEGAYRRSATYKLLVTALDSVIG